MAEGGIVAIDQHQRHHGGGLAGEGLAPDLVAQRPFELIAERPLGVGDAGIERHLVQRRGGDFRAQQDEAHLRTVAVGDDEAHLRVAQERQQMLARPLGGVVLVRHRLMGGVGNERIATQRYDDRLRHGGLRKGDEGPEAFSLDVRSLRGAKRRSNPAFLSGPWIALPSARNDGGSAQMLRALARRATSASLAPGSFRRVMNMSALMTNGL